jgi:hypothetical protein
MKAVKNKPCCQNCAFAVLLQAAQQAFWVCTNALGKPGQLTPVEQTDCCRQYRKRRAPPVRLTPPAVTDEKVRYVPLTQGLFAIVDVEDYERVSRYTWCASGMGNRVYAYRHDNGKTLAMHRFLTNCPQGMVVDHIDGNGLNNRQNNLRVCTQQQNLYNSRPKGKSSKYKGVCRDKRRKGWVVYVRYNRRNIFVGRFKDEIEAARAYDRKAYELFGEYAYLNFPEETRMESQKAKGKNQKEEATRP